MPDFTDIELQLLLSGMGALIDRFGTKTSQEDREECYKLYNKICELLGEEKTW